MLIPLPRVPVLGAGNGSIGLENGMITFQDTLVIPLLGSLGPEIASGFKPDDQLLLPRTQSDGIVGQCLLEGQIQGFVEVILPRDGRTVLS